MHLVTKIFVSSLVCSASLQSSQAKSAENTTESVLGSVAQDAESPKQPTGPAPTSAPSISNAQDQLDATIDAADEDSAVWIPNGSVSLIHFYGFRGDVDPISVAELGASWKYKGYSLSVIQSLTKYYYVYGGDSEVQPADTILRVGRKIAEPVYGFELGTSLSLTLPVSQFSRDHGIQTKPTLSVAGTRSFFDKKLNYTLALAGQYFANRYTTTRTGLGVNGGRPLRQYLYSIDNVVSYSPLPKLSLSGLLRYSRVNYHDVGFRNRVSAAGNTAWLNTNFSIDLGMSYELWEQLTIGGGYSQSDAFEKSGGVREAYLFDQYTTQWYVSLSAGI